MAMLCNDSVGGIEAGRKRIKLAGSEFLFFFALKH
jgi:hypothetical protein